MGNTSSRDQWAGRERLAFIERTAWWRGVVNRADVREVFGISAAQASADLQGYLEMNPGSLAYNLSTKRYEARPEMACVLHTPRLEDAVRMLWGGKGGHVPLGEVGIPSPGGRVDVFSPPVRRAPAEVERRVFMAMDHGKRLRVNYWSVSGGGGKWRELAPRALGHDGYRWHVRAWCFANGGYRDFVLSRMEGADWPSEVFALPEVDADWESVEKILLRANQQLDEAQRRTIERDYGMVDGKLEVLVRRAMREYVLAHLRVADGINRPRHLEMVE